MQFTLRDLLNAVLRHSRAVVLFWTALVVAVIVFYTQTRKLYDSSATIMISLGSEVQGKAEYVNGKNVQLLQREQQIHDEQQILESHDVLLTTAKWIVGDPTPDSPPPELGLRITQARRFFTGQEPEPTLLLCGTRKVTQSLKSVFGKPDTRDEQVQEIARELAKDLGVKAIFDSDALDVGFRYRDPRVAQTVLTLIIAAYLNHHIAVFQSAAATHLLKTQLDRSVKDYHDRLEQFSSYMATQRVYNDDSQVNALIEQREKLGQGLNDALADMQSANARLRFLQSIGPSVKEYERYSTTQVRNKEREELSSKLNDAMLEEEILLNRHPKGSRTYQEEQSKLDELHALLEKEPEQIVDQTEQRRSKASELVESEVIGVTEAQHGDQARIARLLQDRAHLDSEVSNYANNLKQYNALKLDLSLAKRESEQLAQAYVDSHLRSLTSQNSITDVSVIDGPTWDLRPASPRQEIVIAATAVMSAMGGLAILLGCIAMDTTMADSKTAEGQLGAPVIGTFPFAKIGEKEAHLTEIFAREDCAPQVFAREHRAEFARMYHSVRRGGPEGKVVLLTESSSGEGASLLGFGFASFLSLEAHEKAAFIDCTRHSILDCSNEGTGTAKDLALVAWPALKEVATSVRTDAASVLSKMRHEFTYIVIAGGAVKEATDLLAISAIVSATFLIVQAGSTRRVAARHSLTMLERYGFQGVKLILNKRSFYIPAWLMRFV